MVFPITNPIICATLETMYRYTQCSIHNVLYTLSDLCNILSIKSHISGDCCSWHQKTLWTHLLELVVTFHTVMYSIICSVEPLWPLNHHIRSVNIKSLLFKLNFLLLVYILYSYVLYQFVLYVLHMFLSSNNKAPLQSKYFIYSIYDAGVLFFAQKQG